MARAKGRDVVLELMESVARLEVTTAQQAEVMQSLADHVVATSAELTAYSRHMAELWRRMEDVSRRVGEVSQRMGDVSERVGEVSQRMGDLSERVGGLSQRTSSLEGDFHGFAELVVTSAKLSQTVQREVGRLATLMGEFAGGSRTRFETIEERLDRLEKKTG